MCYDLPFGEPKIDRKINKYTIEYIKRFGPYRKYCYILVVDILYPSRSYDRDFEYPILTDHDIPPNSKTRKLMSTFYEKKNYNISLLMLKYSLEKGLILKKIHHIIYAEQKTIYYFND